MRRWILVSALCSAVLAPRAEAAVPDPTTSSVGPCLVVCPSGDYHFWVTVRDVFANPVAGSTVTIDLTSCPGVALCPGRPEDPYLINGRVVLGITNAQGVVDFPIRAGGVCSAAVPIRADGVHLAQRPVASYDQDGNLLVENIDDMIAGLKVGTADPTADFDCDGTVTQVDRDVIFDVHGAHRCDMPVPVRPSTWGRLKASYR